MRQAAMIPSSDINDVWMDSKIDDPVLPWFSNKVRGCSDDAPLWWLVSHASRELLILTLEWLAAVASVYDLGGNPVEEWKGGGRKVGPSIREELRMKHSG